MEIETLPRIAGLASRMYRPKQTPVGNEPIILFVHGGPGFAAANHDVTFFARLLQLTHAAGCVVFDQRGSGKSLKWHDLFTAWHIQHHVHDVGAVIEWIGLRFRAQPVILAAHSWGTILAAQFLKQFRPRVCAYLGISQVVHGLEGERYSYARALSFARERGHLAMEFALKRLGPPPHYGATNLLYLMLQRHVAAAELRVRQLETLKLVPRPAGERFFTSLKFGAGYALSVYKLWPECVGIDIQRTVPRIDIPCVFLSGEVDPITPAYLVSRYLDALECPSKALIVAPSAGHRPHLTHPRALREAICALPRFISEPSRSIAE